VNLQSIYLDTQFCSNDGPVTQGLLCADLGMNSFFSFSLLPDGEKLENKMKKLETQYNSLQVLSTITKLGTKEVHS